MGIGVVTIQRVDEITSIPSADSLELAKVLGWNCVVKKGAFKANDLGVLIQPDTWLPAMPQFAFLDKAPREYVGYGPGYRVKTIKLRGQLSQGLLLPISDFDDIFKMAEDNPSLLSEGTDVTEVIGAKHWEKPLPSQMHGRIKGNFPSFIPKTDQERAQNLKREIFGDKAKPADDVWEVSTKLDGSSITIYHRNGEVGVCSRNLDLKLDDTGNVFVKTAMETGIVDILRKTGMNWAIQGELMGPGVQDNHENLGRPDIFIYDIYDIDAGKYLTPMERQHVVMTLGLRHVPCVLVKPINFTTMEALLDAAVGPSMLAESREGYVYKHQDGQFSFKVINNEFLLAKGE